MTESYIDKSFVKCSYEPPAADSHKGTLGQALVIGGSYGKIGAVTLCAKAALKAGCGLATAFVPECGYVILQSAVPEMMVITDQAQKHISNIAFDIKPQAIGIGPGIGTQSQTQHAVHKFLNNNKTPLVIDADALNILSLNKQWLRLLPPKAILTPHPKELERLIGKWTSDREKLQKAIEFSTLYDCIIVLKDAPTKIIFHDRILVNTSGNAALATAGSGDVLTGIITGLLARSFNPLQAAYIGVYLHGRTADIAIAETAAESFIASDIIQNLGAAFRELTA